MLPTRMPKARRPKEKRDEDEDAAADAGPVGPRHGRRADIARDRTGIADARGLRQPGRDSRAEIVAGAGLAAAAKPPAAKRRSSALRRPDPPHDHRPPCRLRIANRRTGTAIHNHLTTR